MRVFAVSDIHVDYDANARWLETVSQDDYVDDVLIVAGDVSDDISRLQWALETLARRFRRVLFVPGNHDLWVIRDAPTTDSLAKFEALREVVDGVGASMQSYGAHGVAIVPLLAWYDYSFGAPSEELKAMWMDYRACRWPQGLDDAGVAARFAALNPRTAAPDAHTVITFSHYLPRIDLMPDYIPAKHRVVYPVLGTARLDQELRRLGARIHVYGHSHVNRDIEIDGVAYVNNAFGYPRETRIAAKALRCIYEAGVQVCTKELVY